MKERTFFPWASVLCFGLGHLRLSPEVFWRLSLPELNALTGAADAPSLTTRHGLHALMARFPDTKGTKDPADD